MACGRPRVVARDKPVGCIDTSSPVVGTGDFGRNLAEKGGLLHKTPNKDFPCVFLLAFLHFWDQRGPSL